MSKPLVTFADPERAIITYLVSTAAGNPLFAPWNVTVSNQFPTVALVGTATHVQVELDGVPGEDYPFTERATVRVTCYAGPKEPDKAKALASAEQGLLHVHPGDDDVFGTKPLTGRIKTVDPATKNHMVSFTTRVNMRPTQHN